MKNPFASWYGWNEAHQDHPLAGLSTVALIVVGVMVAVVCKPYYWFKSLGAR